MGSAALKMYRGGNEGDGAHFQLSQFLTHGLLLRFALIKDISPSCSHNKLKRNFLRNNRGTSPVLHHSPFQKSPQRPPPRQQDVFGVNQHAKRVTVMTLSGRARGARTHGNV